MLLHYPLYKDLNESFELHTPFVPGMIAGDLVIDANSYFTQSLLVGDPDDSDYLAVGKIENIGGFLKSLYNSTISFYASITEEEMGGHLMRMRYDDGEEIMEYLSLKISIYEDGEDIEHTLTVMAFDGVMIGECDITALDYRAKHRYTMNIEYDRFILYIDDLEMMNVPLSPSFSEFEPTLPADIGIEFGIRL